MGDSKPPKATFDLIDSYANLEGTDVRIVLNDPQFEIAAPAELVLIQGNKRRRADALVVDGDAGRQVIAKLPRRALADGTWRLRLRSGERNSRLNVRLLIQGQRPLVLLWGATALPSALPEPHSREPRPAVRAVESVTATGRKVGRKMLTKLPEQPANALRRVVRRVEARF